MKKLNLFFAVLVCSLVFSIGAKAQAPADYFAGKWNVIALGTPGGDSKMPLILERKDGKLSGGIIDATSNKVLTQFSKVEETEKNVTVYFSSGGYNVYIFMEKKDDNHITGSMMDMFDVTGERAIEKPVAAQP